MRGLLAAIGVAIPPAVIPIAPVIGHVFLDGVFLGSLAGCLLWSIPLLLHLSAKSEPGNGLRSRPQKKRLARSAALLLAAAAFFPPVTNAAPPFPAARQQAVPNSPYQKGASKKGAGKKTPRSRPWDSPGTIVVPYDVKRGIGDAAQVLIPYTEFIRLWKLAHPDEDAQQPRGVVALVTQANYSASLRTLPNSGKKLVAVKGRIVLYCFRDEPTEVAVPFGNVAVRTAQLDGKPAVLFLRRQNAAGSSKPGDQAIGQAGRNRGSRLPQFRLALRGRGMHVLDVEFDLPIQPLPGGGRVTIPLLPVAAGRLSFRLPAKGLQATVAGTSNTYRRRTAGDDELLELGIDRGGTITISWEPQAKQPQNEAVVHAHTETRVRLSDHGVHQQNRIRLSVRRGTIAEATFSIGSPLKLRRITGTDVAGWQLKKTPTGGDVRIFFRRKIANKTELTFELIAPLQFSDEETVVSVHSLGIKPASRRTEKLRISIPQRFSVSLVQSKGFERIDAVRSKPAVRTPVGEKQTVLAFQASNGGGSIVWGIRRRPGVVAVKAEHDVLIRRSDVRVFSRMTFDVSAMPVSLLRLTLPTGFRLHRLTTPDMKSWSYGEDETAVFVELRAPRSGRIQLEMSGAIRRDAVEIAAVSVPAPSLVNKLESHVAVRIASGLRAKLKSSGSWKPLKAESLPRGLRSRQGDAVRFAFRATDAERDPTDAAWGIVFDLSLIRPLLKAEAVTIVAVTDIAVHQTLVMKWSGFTDPYPTAAFTTPGWLADKLDFRVSRGVRVRRAAGEPRADGRVRWIATAATRSRGELVVVATAKLPPSRTDGHRVRGPVLTFERITRGATETELKFEPIKRALHVVLVVNHSSSRIEASKALVLNNIRANELPRSITFPKDVAALVAQAVFRVRLAADETTPEPVWLMKRLPRQRGPGASVT
ncbi:MAG: hypothetical protein IID45_11465, partial [Planctomycetes bacterium]|nr:hypothetical protein [Planctomycetota bacterium]